MIKRFIDFIKNFIKQLRDKRRVKKALKEKMKKTDEDDPFSGMYPLL